MTSNPLKALSRIILGLFLALAVVGFTSSTTSADIRIAPVKKKKKKRVKKDKKPADKKDKKKDKTKKDTKKGASYLSNDDKTLYAGLGAGSLFLSLGIFGVWYSNRRKQQHG